MNKNYLLIILSWSLSVIASAPSTQLIDTPEKYEQLLSTPHEAKNIEIKGLTARLLRGKNDSDFQMLSNDKKRKIVFFIGDQGMQEIISLSLKQKLINIGYTQDYIDYLVKKNMNFKIFVTKAGRNVKIATWDNVLKLIKKSYSRKVYKKIKKALPILKITSFEKIQEDAGFNFLNIQKEGLSHPKYINITRLLESKGELWQVRAFLYNELYLTNLFTGLGYTKTENGEKGYTEYIGINQKLNKYKDSKLIDLGQL